MKFIVNKDEFLNGIRIVSGVATMKSVQPVLANILIEAESKNVIKLTATDLDLTISTEVDAQIEVEGSITLPSKKLNDIFTRLSENLVTFELNEETNIVEISTKNTKFEIVGISASEFPKVAENVSLENGIDIDFKQFTRAIKQAGFAAASYETTGPLSGVVCDIKEEILEIASTDGNRLARVREKIDNIEKKTSQLIIPSRTLQEVLKISGFVEDEKIKIYTEKTKLAIKTSKTLMISKIIEGHYPDYNKLIPETSPKTAKVNRNELISALELISVMVNEKTCIIKFEFSENKLEVKADTSDSGKGKKDLDIEYSDEDLVIAFNYKYVLDGLKNMEDEKVLIGLNTKASPTVFRPDSENDYISLVMPVQIR